MFRSKMKWIEQGEKPTKYFYNLEKTNYEKKLVREVKLENEEIISNPVQVNKEIEVSLQENLHLQNKCQHGQPCTGAKI